MLLLLVVLLAAKIELVSGGLCLLMSLHVISDFLQELALQACVMVGSSDVRDQSHDVEIAYMDSLHWF